MTNFKLVKWKEVSKKLNNLNICLENRSPHSCSERWKNFLKKQYITYIHLKKKLSTFQDQIGHTKRN